MRREEEEGKDNQMCSILKITTELPQSPTNDSILGKRVRSSNNFGSFSVHSLLNGQEKNVLEDTSSLPFPNRYFEDSQEDNEREPKIPKLPDMFPPFPTLAPPQDHARQHLEQPHHGTLEFTPFLLPSPNMFYNPLNPPRLNFSSQMYSPQPNNSPPFLSPAKLFEEKIVLEKPEPKIMQPSQNQDPIVNFPLCDAPNMLMKMSSPEKPLKLEIPQYRPGIPLQTTDNNTTKNKFILLEQPNDIQRKSYKKENRCLLPNPLIISLRELSDDERKNAPQILDGMVSLKLVNNDGSELPPHKQNALESIEGGLNHPLGDDFTTCFSVKVLQTSEGNQFRLIFTVKYRTKGSQGQIEEQIVSRPFAVYSNKHNRNSRKKKEEI